MISKTVTKKKQVVKTKPKVDIISEFTKEVEGGDRCQIRASKYASVIYHSELWKKGGYSSFEDFGEKKVNKAYKTMMNLVMMGDAIKQTGLAEKDIMKVGTSIFKELASYIKADNLNLEVSRKLIDEIYSKKMSFRDAQSFIRTQRLKKAVVKTDVKMIFNFVNEQAKRVEEALKIAEGLAGTKNRNILFEYICLDFELNHKPELAQELIKKLHVKSEDNGKVKKKEPAHKGKTIKKAKKLKAKSQASATV